MTETAFVSVAFGDKRYLEQQERLNFSIRNIYPDAPIYAWTDKMPPESPTFRNSLYGFKPYAIKAALSDGYTKIMFFDPAIVLVNKIDYYQEIVKDYGVLAAQDDNKLTRFCSDAALEYAGRSREEISEWHLVGGSFYYFDFDLQLCNDIYSHWLVAERKGLFGSQSDQASGKLDHAHRNDEAMMALALYCCGSKPLTGDVRYNCESDVAITRKFHFK